LDNESGYYCSNEKRDSPNYHAGYMHYSNDGNWYIVFKEYVLQKSPSRSGIICRLTSKYIYIDIDPQAYLFSKEKIMSDIIFPNIIFS
jgi:hypothetical protein